MKKAVWITGLLWSLLFCAWAGPKGQGFDVSHPYPVSDMDVILDEGAFAGSLFYGIGTDSRAYGVYSNLAVNKLSPRSELSMSFLFYDFLWEEGRSKLEGQHLRIEGNYHRTIFKHSFKETWFPSMFSLGAVGTFGLGQSTVTISEANDGFSSVDPVLLVRGGESVEGTALDLPLGLGIMSSLSLGRRIGWESYAMIQQDILISNNTFQNSMAPTMTIGSNLYLRSPIDYQFPWEYGAGLTFTPAANSVANSSTITLQINLRRRW